MRFLTQVCLVVMLSASFLSCKKETSWDIDAALPLAKSHLNISNFFGDSIFKPDPTGLLHIDFSETIVDYTMDSLVHLPDTTVKISFASPFTTSLGPNTQIYANNASTDKEITFDISNGVELNKAIVRKGFLKIVYSNTYAQPLNFNYFINSASLYGNVFHVNQTIQGGSISNPGSLTKIYPLDGYEINLTGLSQNKINTLVQTYTITTDASGQTGVLNLGEGLKIEISFIDMVPEYIQGYFGQQNLSFGPDSSFIGLFSNFNVSNLALTQAAINFRIINEFGVELSSSINTLKSVKTTPYNSVILNSGNLLQSININRAGKTNNPSQPVFPWVKQITINSSNSNLNAFLENIPSYLGYSISAKINPLGNTSAANDFAYYGHGLKVLADVDIPLALSADYFSLVSYSKIDLTQLKEIDNVNTCDIIMQARNNYPFKAKLQGYMLNEYGQTIDSIFINGQNIIESAVTDLSNTVLNYTDTKLAVTFDKAKNENLKQCKQIKFVSHFYLPNQPTPIQINSSNYLDLVLSADVNYNVKVK